MIGQKKKPQKTKPKFAVISACLILPKSFVFELMYIEAGTNTVFCGMI